MSPRPFVPMLLSLFACAPVYVPGPPPSPTLSQRGEVQAAAHWSTAGLGGWLAWSPLENVAVAAAVGGGGDRSDSVNYDRHFDVEGLIGWYGASDMFRTSIFAGYGRGDAAAGYRDWDLASGSTSGTRWAAGSYEKFFVQGMIGGSRMVFWTDEIVMDLLLTLRFTNLRFSHLQGTALLESRADGTSAWFIEPSYVTRIGGEHVLLELEVGGAGALDSVAFDYRSLRISGGIVVRFQ